MMKKSEVLKIISDGFSEQYNCKAYTTSNFSFDLIPAMMLDPSIEYRPGYFVKLKHSFSNREVIANIVVANERRQPTMYVILKRDEDASVIERVKKSCKGSLDIVVLD
jgi:hypothetical protein